MITNYTIRNTHTHTKSNILVTFSNEHTGQVGSTLKAVTRTHAHGLNLGQAYVFHDPQCYRLEASLSDVS